MKRAMTFAAGLAIGYVAGSRAGRERYEQIKQKAYEIGQQPTVAARETLREQAGAATKTVVEKVTDAASGLAHKLGTTGDAADRSSPARPATRATAQRDATPDGPAL